MLDAAVRIFAERGYHGAAMDGIAAAAGVTKPMVYAYFGSKDGLYLACIEHAGRRMMAAVDEAGSREAHPERRLWRRLLAFFEFVAEHRDEWRVLHREAAASGGPFPDQVARARARVIEIVIRQFEETSEAAALPPDGLEPIAHALVGACESLANRLVDRPDEPPEAPALTVMNLVWVGFEGLAQGRRWKP